MTAEQIEAVNPHRGVMRMIDHVAYHSPGLDRMVAIREIRDDEFWGPGHIPGRPIFPGVLMIEAAAQVCSLLYLMRMEGVDFLGFVGADNFRFRGQVVPGDRLVILALEVEFRKRRSICDVQGLVGDTIVFEGRVTGMPL
ncbi:3-hydroxyacyl-[acyl-carrier-protein] dehydratase FabZ [Mucisphaera calidilacus]|uniref:3-hydroxyacyl-[acyl-carrier-protein] dehydratase FabZ n=1 Tax=Mucisphaera calidilacus TaxID=2527982 RepID=A0A518BX73_9BACT|nr:3-hydroxyacyl-[acyl-carrier-protein] dehydratase FabZ [Mucisphaera calidilacus]